MSSKPPQIEDSLGSDGGGGWRALRGRLTKKALDEARQVLVMFVYLWLLFGMFAIHETIVLAEHNIRFSPFGVAALNAFILAKVMLVAGKLDVARGLKDRPLIYPVLFQSVVFAIVFICFHVAEHIVIGVWRGKTISESIPGIGGGGLLGILAVGLIMSIALVPFFAFREVARVIGAAELRALLLTRGARTAAHASKTPPPGDG